MKSLFINPKTNAIYLPNSKRDLIELATDKPIDFE